MSEYCLNRDMVLPFTPIIANDYSRGILDGLRIARRAVDDLKINGLPADMPVCEAMPIILAAIDGLIENNKEG